MEDELFLTGLAAGGLTEVCVCECVCRHCKSAIKASLCVRVCACLCLQSCVLVQHVFDVLFS